MFYAGSAHTLSLVLRFDCGVRYTDWSPLATKSTSQTSSRCVLLILDYIIASTVLTSYSSAEQFRNHKVVYRRYAGLFFCVCVDANDNELAYLEAIHLFVEVLGEPHALIPHPTLETHVSLRLLL